MQWIEAYNIQGITYLLFPNTPPPLPQNKKEKKRNIRAISVLQTAFPYFVTLLFFL